MKHLYLVGREDEGGGLRIEAPRCYTDGEEARERFDELVLQARGERYFVFQLPAACVIASTGDARDDVEAMRARHVAADAEEAAREMRVQPALVDTRPAKLITGILEGVLVTRTVFEDEIAMIESIVDRKLTLEEVFRAGAVLDTLRQAMRIAAATGNR